MNVDKIQAVWIDSRKKCHARFMRDMNICLDPGICKILAQEVKFCTDADQIVAINYENKLEEIRMILSVWTKRQLTPLGKITVIKTLVI